MIKQEDVTIIIPHLGATIIQSSALVDCMISLEETFDGPITIATNGENKYQDMGYRYAGLTNNRGQYSNIHISEQGQCKAVNAAATLVTTPWILVTNDDMIFPPGWFEKLTQNQYGINQIDDKRRNWKPLCISPQLVEPTPGAPTFLTEFCGGAGGDFDKKKFLKFVEYNNNIPKDFKSIRTGFNLPFLITKELWDLIGGYDINYDPWGSNSDSDLEYKIRLAGVQPYQNTNCLVYHFSQTSGTFSPEHQDAWQKNWNYFIDKWGFPRAESPEIWTADFKIPTKEEGRKFNPFWEGKYGN